MWQILGVILKFLCTIFSPINECWTNHNDLPENMENLRSKDVAVKSRMQGLESKLTKESAECFNKKEPKPEVQNWFRRVEIARQNIEAVQQEYGNVTYCLRACLGKRVLKRIEEMEKLHQEGGLLHNLGSLLVEVRSDYRLPTTDLFGESANLKVEEIWAELMNGEAKKIGVHGMTGAGKTAIMKNIHNRLLGEKKFKHVLWVSAAEAKSLHQLQKNVVSALDRYEKNFSKLEDETNRAAMLYGTLRGSDQWVLILDGLWEAFELAEVGIPEPTDENGCKLLLTTQSVEACRVMGYKEIHVELLPKEEAWSLFLDRVGGDLSRNSEVEFIAKQVADECGRLPLAIITVASSLKGIDDIHDWRNVLQQLKKSSKGHKPMDKVLERIKLSYDRLNPDHGTRNELQRCLLYSALYPENFDIERKELITYLVAEGTNEVDDSRQAKFDLWHSSLNRLIEASLLEFGSRGEKYVKMHDLIRDMAINEMNANKENLTIVEAGKQLTEWPSDETWKKNPKIVSLMWNNISQVRPVLLKHKCRLQTLLLARNKNLVEIPDSFFSNMYYLRVLDLSYTGIANLPESISDMEKLVALYLKHCEQLRHLPSLAKLRALRELDLQFTGIKELPQSMDMLTEVRHLNLWIPDLEALSFDLDKLSQLQHLTLFLGSATLRLKGKEFECLKRLEMFEGQFHDLSSFNSFVTCSVHNLNEVKEYILQLGQSEKLQEQVCEKCIMVTKYVSDKEQGAVLLPPDVEYLEVADSQRLKFTYISPTNTNVNMSIDSSFNDDNETLFVSLYSMSGDPYRKERAVIQPGAFAQLRFLKIECLSGIRHLFGLLPPLQNLEELVLYGCNQMEKILEHIAEENYKAQMYGESSSGHSDNIIFELPKLRILSLSSLPKLRSVLPGLLWCPSIIYITILGCPQLKKFPFAPRIDDITPPAELKAIYVEDEKWWDSLNWNPFFKDVFQPVCQFQSQRST